MSDMALQCGFGLIALVMLAFALSEDRSAVPFRDHVKVAVAGLATLVPERRGEVAALGLKALAAGTLATCMTGAVVGLLEG